MDQETYTNITNFLQNGTIPDIISNKSNFRRTCRKFVIGTGTKYSNLYFQKQKYESHFTIKPESMHKPVESLEEGLDYSVQKTLATELYNVVKKEDVNDSLQQIHNLSGCGGRDRMSFVVDSLKLYLDGNKTALIDKYRSCDVCKDRKLHHEVPALVPIYSSKPFERLIIDFTFMRSINDTQLITVFSAIDHFTKVLFMKVVPNRETQTVIHCLEEMMDEYDVNRIHILQSDNGMEFRSSALKAFVEQRGGTIVHGSPRHPQSQGAVERVHLTIKDIVHSLIMKYGGSVAMHVPSAVRTYNANYQSTIHNSPINALKQSSDVNRNAALKTLTDIRRNQVICGERNVRRRAKRIDVSKRIEVGDYVFITDKPSTTGRVLGCERYPLAEVIDRKKNNSCN